LVAGIAKRGRRWPHTPSPNASFLVRLRPNAIRFEEEVDLDNALYLYTLKSWLDAHGRFAESAERTICIPEST
jgi:hypothetical protein